MKRLVTVLVVLGWLVPHGVEPQSVRTVSIDGTIGHATAFTQTPYVGDNGAVADAMLAFRFSDAPGHSLIGAAVVSRWDILSNGYDASCTPLPDGSCTPHMPFFAMRAVVFGWEVLSSGHASLRLTAGPAFFRFRDGEPQSNGLHARADLGSALAGRVGVVISANWSKVNSYRDTEFDYRAITAGLRIR